MNLVSLGRFSVLSLVTCASIATAQSSSNSTQPSPGTPIPAAAQSYFGLYTLGGQYTYDTDKYALRLGVGGRSIVVVFGNGVGLDAAVLFPISGSLATRSRVSLGGGLDINTYVAPYFDGMNCGENDSRPCSHGLNLVAFRPHVLVQYETRLNQKVIFFTEASLGYAIAPQTGSVVYPGFRVGLNFR